MKPAPTPQPSKGPAKPVSAAAATAKPAPDAAPPKPEHPAHHEPVDEAIAAQSLVERLMPWAISLTVHAAMVMVAIFVVWVTVRQKEALEEEETIVPAVALGVKPGGPKTGTIKGMPGDPNASMQVRSVDVASALKDPLGGGAGAGVGAGVGSGVGNTKVDGFGAIIGSGGGAGSGNPSGNPFGKAVGHGDGPFRDPGVFGTGGGNAKNIVIVIDSSGSVLPTMPFIIRELKRTISQLSEVQTFSVLFFQNGQAVEVPPKGLKQATSKAKSDAVDWLSLEMGNIVPSGATTPEQTLKTALGYRPDLMVVLSDNITGNGRYEIDQAVLLAQIKQANKRPTKINTIQFLTPDPLAAYGKKPTLQLVADSTGGIYRFVSRKELGLEQ